MIENAEALREDIRRLCSFAEIEEWLMAHTPVKRVKFHDIARVEDAPLIHGTALGGEPRPWYMPAEEPEEEYPARNSGWICKLQFWSPPQDWRGREVLSALGVIRITHMHDVRHIDGGRLFTYHAVLFSEDWSAMWLAEKLLGVRHG